MFLGTLQLGLNHQIVHIENPASSGHQSYSFLAYRNLMCYHSMSAFSDFEELDVIEQNKYKYPEIQIETSRNERYITLRTNVGNSVIRKIKIRNDKHGYLDCTVDISDDNTLKILPFSKLKVLIGGQILFSGQIVDSDSTKNGVLSVRCAGFISYLKNIILMDSTSENGDLSLPNMTFTNIVQNFLQDKFNEAFPSIFDYSTIRITNDGFDIESSDNFVIKSGTTLFDAFNLIAMITNCDFGVDELNRFYFLPKSDLVIDHFHVGYDMEDADLKEDIESIKNVVSVFRKTDTGFDHVVTVRNDESVANHGERTLKQNVPSTISNEEATALANYYLQNNLEPATVVNLKKLKFLEVFRNGFYKITFPRERQTVDYVNIETAENISGLGTLSNEKSFHGSMSYRVFPALQNDVLFTITEDFTLGYVHNVSFYVYANHNATLHIKLFTSGITSTSRYVDVNNLQSWTKISIAFSGNSNVVRKIQVITNTVITAPIYFDYFTIEYEGYKTVTVRHSESNFMIDSSTNYVDVRFGKESKRIDNYIRNLLDIVRVGDI